MTVIKLQLPKEAMTLMASMTPGDAFREMVKKEGITFMALITFGMIFTPIIEDLSGAEVAHVTYWANGQVSVTEFKPGNDWLKLIYVGPWQGSPPGFDEAVAIYEATMEETK